MSARSTLILLSFSNQGDMNFKIRKCTSGYSFYIRVRVIIICFSIFSGIDYSESFHLRHLYASGYLFQMPIIHYSGLFIYVHMLVSRLKSDCDCYFSGTFYTFTT